MLTYLLNLVEFVKIFLRELKVEDLNVLRKPLSVGALGQYAVTLLHVPTKSNLCGRLVVLLGKLCDRWQLQDVNGCKWTVRRPMGE